MESGPPSSGPAARLVYEDLFAHQFAYAKHVEDLRHGGSEIVHAQPDATLLHVEAQSHKDARTGRIDEPHAGEIEDDLLCTDGCVADRPTERLRAVEVHLTLEMDGRFRFLVDVGMEHGILSLGELIQYQGCSRSAGVQAHAVYVVQDDLVTIPHGSLGARGRILKPVKEIEPGTAVGDHQ